MVSSLCHELPLIWFMARLSTILKNLSLAISGSGFQNSDSGHFFFFLFFLVANSDYAVE